MGGMSGEAWDLFLRRRKCGRRRRGSARLCATRNANLEHALPFAMEPVVYDFAVNEHGTFAELLRGDEARSRGVITG